MFYCKIVSNASSGTAKHRGWLGYHRPTNDLSVLLLLLFVVRLTTVAKAMDPLHIMRISCCPMRVFFKTGYYVI